MNPSKAIAKPQTERERELFNLLPVIEKHHYTTPYMLTNLAVVRANAKEFQRLLPGTKIYYAVKCFSDIEVIKELDKSVDGYDVASVEEVRKLHNLGIKSSRLIFSNPVKSEQALAAAHRLGVKKFAYQSHNELVKIKKHIKKPEVYLRIKVPDKTSVLSFSNKFGCDPEQALELLLKARDLGLTPIGVTFHVGSQAKVTNVWEKAIKQAASIIQQAEDHGLKLSLLNIGGGFPAHYGSEDPTLPETLSVVRSALAKNVPKNTMTIVAEPGRYMVADSSVIITSIIGVEERGDKTWLYLDIGTFQAFIEIFELGYFPYPVYSVDHLYRRLPISNVQKYVLTGPSCDSYDTMATDVILPADLAIGNKLLIDKTGAYTIVYGSNFNGFKVPRRHFVDISEEGLEAA
jgi:ornithine decarboxylase